MKNYSIVDTEKFNSLKEDIKNSLTSAIDDLFAGSHMVSINSTGESTYITAEYVDEKGSKRTRVLWVDAIMYKEN